MAFKLAEAFVRLFADPTDLKAGFRSAEKDTTAFTAKMGSGLKTLARIAFPSGVAAGIIAAGKAAINAADRMLELAQQTGLTTEELSRLQYGASTAGLDIEELNVGLRYLNKTMFEASRGGEEATDALRAVGLSAADIKEKSPHEILLEIADAFAKGEVHGNRAAIAMKIFGRSGASMIPMLNEGRAGLEKMGAASDAVGYTISTEFAEQADRFNDNVQLMKNNTLGLARTITADVLPAVNALMSYFMGEYAKGLEETAKRTSGFKGMSDALAAGFLAIAAGAKQAAAAAIFLFKSLGDVDENGVLKEYEARLKAIGDEWAEAVLDLTNPRPKDNLGTGSPLDPLIKSTKKAEDELKHLGKTGKEILEEFDSNAEKTRELQSMLGREFMQMLGAHEQYAREEARATYEERKLQIEKLIDVYGEKNDLILQNEKWLTQRLLQIDAEYATGVAGILRRIELEYGTYTQRLEVMVSNFVTSAERGLGDMFFEAIKGNTEGVKDAFKSMLDDMLREITAFLAKEAVKKLISLALDWYLNRTGTSSPTGTVTSTGSFGGAGAWANGGIVPGGFKAFASGGVVTNPTIGLVGEGRYNEAVVPLPDGKSIPAIVKNAGSDQPIVIDQTIMLAPDPRVMRPSDVISIVSGDIYAGGQIRRAIRARG